MMKRMVIFGAMILFSCSPQDQLPADILKPQKMESVMWDYFRADAYCAEILKGDSTREDTLLNIQYQQSIFSQHKISKDDFYRSYRYYLSHPSLMNAVLDSMISKRNKSQYAPVLEKLRMNL